MNFYEQAARYSESMMRKEPALLRDLREATSRELRHDDMLTEPVVGAFLNMLIRVSGAKKVLEIGTFTGYATLWMAMALPADGMVVTCEINEKYARIARRYFERFQKDRLKNWNGSHSASGSQIHAFEEEKPFRRPGDPAEIRLHMGPALEASLPDEIDFVFLDADKEHYPEYYEKILPHLVPGGIMVVDNAFWSGEVWGFGTKRDAGSIIKEGAPSDRKAASIDRLNRIISDDPKVENVVLSVRDGLHLIRKI
jgi:caffeoyl-CoA O-methyltransferase